MFTHWYKHVLTFHQEEINRADLGPSEVTGKIKTKFHQPFLFTPTPRLCSQGAGRKACSHLTFWLFPQLFKPSLIGFWSLWCCMWIKESAVSPWNSGQACGLILEWFAQLCHGEGLPRPALQPPSTHVAWGSLLPLALCSAQHGQCMATFIPSGKSCSESSKCSASSELSELLSHQKPSWERAHECYRNEIAGK